MGMAGYDGMAAVQSESALTAIRMMFTVVPAVIFAITFLVLKFYDLDKKLPQLRKEQGGV